MGILILNSELLHVTVKARERITGSVETSGDQKGVNNADILDRSVGDRRKHGVTRAAITSSSTANPTDLGHVALEVVGVSSGVFHVFVIMTSFGRILTKFGVAKTKKFFLIVRRNLDFFG